MSGNPNRGGDRAPPEDRDDTPGGGPPQSPPGSPPGRDRAPGQSESFRVLLDRVRDGLEPHHRRDLEALPNVVGVGLGEQRVDGERTGEPAVRVHVDQKHPLSKLPTEAIIPESVRANGEEIQTDVIESGGRFTPDSATWGGTAAPNRDARIRRMPGGVQIGIDGQPATSTALVRYNGQPSVVMCRHAVADGRVDPEGRTVYSPAVATNRTRIGEVAAVAPWHSGTQRTQADAVIVDIDIVDGKPAVSEEYLPPIRPREIAYSPNRERNVVQIASSTGIEGGPILTTDFSTTVDYGFGSVRYESLMVADLPGEPGTSGSAIIQMDPESGTHTLVGIHMGSSPDQALIVPWQNLEDTFAGELRLP